MLGDGTIEGFVGGVCAESTVRLYSLRVLETGEALLLRLVPGDGGSDSEDPIEGAIVEHNPCLSGGALEIVLEPQLSAARIVVVGSAPIPLALAKLAGAAEYDVVQASSGDDIHPGPGDAAVIVASHGSDEERVLSDALTTGVSYVALVASRTRGTAVRDALDVPDQLRAAAHARWARHRRAHAGGDRHLDPRRDPAPRPPRRRRLPSLGGHHDRRRSGVRHAGRRHGRHSATRGRRRHVFFCGGHCRDSYAAQHAVHGAG